LAPILTIDDIEESTLIPIVCKFCERYATYIEFDFVIHLHEAHGIGRGYLYTSPTPYTQSRSWSDDFRIRDAIIEGKKLGSELDEDSIEKLDMAYSKRLGKTSSQVFPSIQETRVLATTHEAIGVGQNFGNRLWSQQHTFAPIVSIDEFFRDDYDKPYSALRNHKLEESPCYPTIGAKPAGGYILYYCEICQPEFANDSAVSNITLSVIEHHCKYKDPDRHKAEILARLELKSNQVGEQ
jgi:hypothetical protein